MLNFTCFFAKKTNFVVVKFLHVIHKFGFREVNNLWQQTFGYPFVKLRLFPVGGIFIS